MTLFSLDEILAASLCNPILTHRHGEAIFFVMDNKWGVKFARAALGVKRRDKLFNSQIYLAACDLAPMVGGKTEVVFPKSHPHEDLRGRHLHGYFTKLCQLYQTDEGAKCAREVIQQKLLDLGLVCKDLKLCNLGHFENQPMLLDAGHIHEIGQNSL